MFAIRRGLYDMLGIAPDSSLDMIKRAYRLLAMKYHPDKKTGSEELFRDITSAYEILSDPEKRSVYDLEGDRNQIDDNLTTFFHTMFTSKSKSSAVKPPSLTIEIEITLEEAHRGCRTDVMIRRSVFCLDCDGQGGSNITKCMDCNGLGVKLIIEKVGHSTIRQNKKQCGSCTGTGKCIHTLCAFCHGKTTILETERVSMFIQPVIVEKGVIILAGRGNKGKSGTSGDVRIIVNTSRHEIFTRKGNDLHMIQTISLLEALTGYNGTVRHLNGQLLSLATTTCITPGMIVPYVGHGMTVTGVLFVTFEITFPKDIDSSQKRMLQDIFI